MAGEGEGKDAEAALAQLCRDYWYPLYAFARRQGFSGYDAQDITQGFFSHILEAGTLGRADAAQGKFRTFLLGAMQHYIANERRHHAAQKRGGGMAVVSFDEMEAEQRFALEPQHTETPEALFERSWAFALIERVAQRLEEEYLNAGRAELFALLRPLLAGDAARPGYGDIGAKLGMSANALSSAVFRMRRRYGELMREEIAQTVVSPEEVGEEISYLIGILGRG